MAAVGAEFHVVESFGEGRTGKTGGQPAAAAVPTRAEGRTVKLFESPAQVADSNGIVVAAHQPHTGHRSKIAVDQSQQARFGEFLAHIALKIATVAAGTAVGTKGEIDGERHLIGKLAEYDVVVDVFEHDSLYDEKNTERRCYEACAP